MSWYPLLETRLRLTSRNALPRGTAALLVLVAAAACGGETNDAASDGGLRSDVRVDPSAGICPRYPPVPETNCRGPFEAGQMSCIYAPSRTSPNTYVYSCTDGGWLPPELLGACEGYQGAINENGVEECLAECIVDDGGECCTCDLTSGGVLSKCGPC
jgi:hypothetical protein